MKIFSVASVSVAAIMAMALFDAKPAEARKGSSFSGSRASMSGRSFARPSSRSFVKSVTKKSTASLSLRRKVVHKPRIKHVAKVDRALRKKGSASAFVKKGSTSALVKKGTLSSANLSFKKLPLHKAAAGNAHRVGRLGLPKNVKPKLTLAHAPRADLHMRLAPFVQRHWKKSFFWVAVAGVGYLTVPELYYDRFYRCVSVGDPDYESCISVLSYAAIEEEEEVRRVRSPMPAAAAYRYRAKVEPTPEARQTCSFDPFVERQWNRSFVWVQIPQVGNVTVPEDHYDRFYGKLGDEPPNYPAACKVLVEAAAADTVATTGLDLERRL